MTLKTMPIKFHHSPKHFLWVRKSFTIEKKIEEKNFHQSFPLDTAIEILTTLPESFGQNSESFLLTAILRWRIWKKNSCRSKSRFQFSWWFSGNWLTAGATLAIIAWNRRAKVVSMSTKDDKDGKTEKNNASESCRTERGIAEKWFQYDLIDSW